MSKRNRLFTALVVSLLVSCSLISGCASGTPTSTVSGTPSVAAGQSNSTKTEISAADGSGSDAQSEPSITGQASMDFEYEKTVSYDENGKNVDCILLKRYTGSDKQVVMPDTIEGLPVMLVKDGIFSGSSVEDVIMPDTVKIIDIGCFQDCTTLKSIKLSSGMEEIPWSTFKNCTSLTGIVIPEGVKVIGADSFLGCSSLTQVTIPETVKNIESMAFKNCTSLKEIAFPSQLDQIGYDVLYNTALVNEAPEGEIYVGNVFLSYKFDNGGGDFPTDESVMALHEKGKLTVREGTRIIASTAVYNSSSARTSEMPALDIEIPDSVVFCGSSSFYYINIGTLAINAAMAKTSEDFISGCPIKAIHWAEDVSEIGEKLLADTYMETIEIPASVKRINGHAFSGSTVKNILIHEGTEYIHSDAFNNCDRLEKLYLPSTLKEFGEDYGGAFDNAKKTVIYTTAGSVGEQIGKKYGLTVNIIEDESQFPV